MTKTLDISPDLKLPLDAVTETFGILAVKGAGKSNAGVVMAEQMYKAGLPFVAIDPKGDWWGMRSAKDGKGPGLEIALFGASSRKRKNKPEPDFPLEETAGKFIADLLVDERIPSILDVSGFSEAAKTRFLLDFTTQLFERNEEPLHVFCEECDDYIPQKPFREQTRLVHIFSKLVKQGRSFGLGVTLISQRSAVVNKNVLTQIGTLIPLRTTSPQDIKAIAEWVKYHGQSTEIVETLSSLDAGEAWVWSPQFLRKVERITFRRRETYDSGATPKVGEKRRMVTLADIDRGALEKRLAETIERAKADDPKELRRQIVRLEKELRAKPVETQVQEKVVEVSTLTDVDRKQIEIVGRRLLSVEKTIEKAAGDIRDLVPVIDRALQKATPSRSVAPPPADPKPRLRGPLATTVLARGEGDVKLKAGARRILETLARHHPMKVSRSQLGTLAKFKVTGGTFQTYFSTLKREGLIQEAGGLIAITDAGMAYVGESARRPQTAQETQEMWRSALKAGARKMLDVLIEVYPDPVDREELGERVEMATNGGTFQTYLSTLRRNGLADVEGSSIRASDTLFMGGE